MTEEKKKETIREKIRDNINFFMERRGYNQVDLAEAMGISSATASEWCTGKKTPRIDKIEEIATWLNIEVSDIVGSRFSKSDKNYYLDPETRIMAEEIHKNPKLKLLFDAAKNASAEDLQTTHTMLLALKKKEQGDE